MRILKLRVRGKNIITQRRREAEGVEEKGEKGKRQRGKEAKRLRGRGGGQLLS